MAIWYFMFQLNRLFYEWFPLLTPAIVKGVIAVYILLFIFQIFVWVKCNRGSNFGDLKERLQAWWYIVLIFTLIFLTRQWCITLLWMGISLYALHEYFHVIPKLLEHKRVRLWAYLSIPIQYTFILTHSYELFLVFIPVYVYLMLPIRMIIVGTTEGFLKAIGSIFWGVMMAGYSLSYVAYLPVFSATRELEAGSLGLMLFLLIVTELNDASQYLWGKLFGKHKIVPNISPKKTYEGLIGGVITSIILSVFLAPFLTPMNHVFSIFVGIVLSLGGFLGDIVMSALKRDVKVKDFGKLLPGHGGLLDRIDSLIFTAPLFFYLMYWKFR